MEEEKVSIAWIITVIIMVVAILGFFVWLGLTVDTASGAPAYPWPYPPLGPIETEPEAYGFACSKMRAYTDLGPEHSTWYGWARVKRFFDGTERVYEMRWLYYEPSSFGGINVWGAQFAPIHDGWYIWEAGSIMGHPIQELPIQRYIQCERQFAPLVVREQSRERHDVERPLPTPAPTMCGPDPKACEATATPITIIIGNEP